MRAKPSISPDGERLMIDLCHKACDDMSQAIDRIMQLVPEDDKALQGYIMTSILASCATAAVSNYFEFLNGAVSDRPLTGKEFQHRLEHTLIRIGKVLIEGHAKREHMPTQH